MSITVTLELSEKVIERAREAAERTGQEIEAVLAEWLENLTASEDKLPFERGATYPIYTPYENEAAAQVLYDMLKEGKDTKDNKLNFPSDAQLVIYTPFFEN